MKRRDFLKGILSTPVIAVGLAKASNDLSILKVSPKPSEVEDSEDMKKIKEEREIVEAMEEVQPTGTCSITTSATPSYASSSGLYDSTSEYFKIEGKRFAEQLQRKVDDIIIEALKG